LDALNPAAIAILATLLSAAVLSDMRHNRIPNVFSGAGFLAGVALHSIAAGPHGLIDSLAGAAIALGLFLPFYLARGIAAGDVKLMVAVGSLLGAPGALIATAATLMAGALLALGFVTYRTLKPAFTNHEPALMHLLMWRQTLSSMRKERFPYAAAIAAGSLFAVWQSNSGVMPT
jgi:prepilin peptidase CpaA